ncbi:MAG: single-stranded-DNA-specific exonuclease RecJ, partial [Pseudomonadota bacterium]
MQSAAPHQKLFLDVSTSASGHRWLERPDRRQLGVAEAMVQTHGLPEVLARILAARGVSSEEADAFLNPTLRDLMVDPSTFTDMNRACERLCGATERGERIAIFGDYDVDGAASSALLGRFFRHHGIPHEIYIPDRIFE